MGAGRPKVCFVATSSWSIRLFLIPHLVALSRSYDVTVIANEDCSELLAGPAPSVRARVFPIEREISLIRDIAALSRIATFFVRERFDAVLTVAPKAGLIGMLAAAFARVPFRCHVFQGEVWATRRNPVRAILKSCDRVVARLAHGVLAVSRSERDFLIGQRIVDSQVSRVLGHGSIAGIDTERFAPDRIRRERWRKELAIADDAMLLLFMGRLKADKGVLDLVEAWKSLALVHPSLHLAIVGPDEEDICKQIDSAVGSVLRRRLHVSAFSSEPETWMAAADIFTLPSYREGLSNVILEASACGVPVIASRIYGIVDAMVENETGLMHPPGDRAALSGCIDRLVRDADLRARLGAGGRTFVTSRFRQGEVVSRFVEYVSAEIERAVEGAR